MSPLSFKGLFIPFSPFLFLSLWNKSFVVPIFESGNKSLISNYRGISIQSTIPKLLDCLMSSFLSWNCEAILIEQQHGFRNGRFTTSNLVLYLSDIIRCFESGIQIDAVYTDFSKALDRVNLNLLLAKLQSLGVHGALHRWFRSLMWPNPNGSL
ncbi:hypothetical protein WA026_002720 [Henosepilachna vigintioctopunctata]|uniref:Reverse transcriptase domain-containing protein n=1 Tax=Henosepilachna vigintioctopunctata TaxID=420089 RepID=A0AAW1TVQ8_9CUCU